MPPGEERRLCEGCNLPPPADWCWANKPFDCWMSLPPRNIEPRKLWELLRDMDARLRMLEK